jgi:hypothetical protein
MRWAAVAMTSLLTAETSWSRRSGDERAVG